MFRVKRIEMSITVYQLTPQEVLFFDCFTARMKAHWSFETSVTVHWSTQRNVSSPKVTSLLRNLNLALYVCTLTAMVPVLGALYVYERMHLNGLCRNVQWQLVVMGFFSCMEYTVRIYVTVYFIFSYVLQIVGRTLRLLQVTTVSSVAWLWWQHSWEMIWSSENEKWKPLSTVECTCRLCSDL